MKAGSSAADAAAATVDKKRAVTGIDAVKEVGGSHGSAVGGAAKLAGFVAAAPDQDEKENVAVVEADVLDLGAKHGSDENLVVKAQQLAVVHLCVFFNLHFSFFSTYN